MEIKIIRNLGKTKDEIVVNEHYVFKLKLRKETMPKGNERVCLTARKIGYTTKGVKKELFTAKQTNTNKGD